MFQKKVSEKDYRFSIGQIVRIGSKEEILKSLDISNKFQGYLFTHQMWDYSGKILTIIDNEDLRKKMGGIGFRRIRDKLEWKYLKPNLLKAYKAVFQ